MTAPVLAALAHPATGALVVQVAAVAALVAAGTVAGVLFAVALSTVPALATMPLRRYVSTHVLLGRNWDPTMPVVVLSATALDAVLAVLAPDGVRTALFTVGAVLLAGVSVVSHWGNVPINRRLRTLDLDALPAGWSDPRPAWRRLHLVRTALAVVALVVTATAVTLP